MTGEGLEMFFAARVTDETAAEIPTYSTNCERKTRGNSGTLLQTKASAITIFRIYTLWVQEEFVDCLYIRSQ